MPYVEGFGTWPFGEEWLLEAMAASYLPLMRVLERRAAGARGAGDRRRDARARGPARAAGGGGAVPAFMRGVRRECHRLDSAGLEQATASGAAARALRARRARLRMGGGRLRSARRGDLLGALRRLRAGRHGELWASAATHAVLPLLATETGRARSSSHRDGRAPRALRGLGAAGFWLPECAYRPGLEEHARGRGRARLLRRPDRSRRCARPARAGDRRPERSRCRSTGARSRCVWDEHGYPADPAYRDYHARR